MAKKVKITKKELPFLKGDLNLDETVLKKLNAVQNKYKTQFKERIEATKTVALQRYTEKIKSLTKAKTAMLKEYNAEIKKYQTLVQDLKDTGKVQPKQTPPKKTK
jgi:uncharacterized membrane-anchored protein YhcB (DUF1043 family)